MSTVQAQLPAEELLRAAARLSQPELEQFVRQVIVLQAQRRAPYLPQAEAELLIKINQGVPQAVQKRYNELIDKRRQQTLTEAEHGELLRLTEQVEALEARRLEHLAELARLRRTTLTELMHNLGIQKPKYA
jgi:hypothetical protein